MLTAWPHLAWVTLEPPARDGGGGQRRQHFQIEALRARASVAVAAPSGDEELRHTLTSRARQVLARAPIRRRTVFGDRVLQEIETDSSIDAVVIAHIETALVLPQLLRQSRVPVLVDLHNVFSRWESSKGNSAEARAWRRRERWLLRAASSVSVVSEDEKTWLGSGPSIVVAPNGVEPAEWTVSPARDAGGLAVFGSWEHEPNRIGLDWFLSDVWWRVRAVRPEEVLHVYGPGRIDGPLPAGVEFVGRTETLAADLACRRGIIVPIVKGVGSRVKFVESLMSGVPVVSTALGAEGYDVPHDLYFRADEPETFAAACLATLEGRGVHAAAAARLYVAENLNWGRVTRPIEDAVLRLVRDGGRTTRA